MKRVLIPLAPGFEEIDKIKFLADTSLDSLKDHDFDMIILPGGTVGTENLKKDVRIKKIVERLYKKGKFVTAICAAPTVLSAIGITAGKTVTSYPGVRNILQKEKLSDERVVVDGNIVTSQGPGTAIE